MSCTPQRAFSTFAFLLGTLLFVAAEAQATKAKLPLSQVTTVTVGSKRVLCALFHGRQTWVVAKHVKGSTYKTASGNRAAKSACAAVGVLGTVSLSELPSSDGIINQNSGASVHLSAVSGTPPLLPEIPTSSVKDLFWRPGVIDSIATGNANAQQCSELFNSTSDGLSGGFSACYLTQGVGFAFQTVLQAGVTLCNMKLIPTPANVSSGAVSVVSGSLPNNDIGQIFSVPIGAQSRLVRVDTSGKVIFIRVYGSASNTANGDTYRFDYWRCDIGSQRLDEYQNTEVKADGRYIFNAADASHGTNNSGVIASLKRDANNILVFDPSKPRSASSSNLTSDGSFRFKSALTVDSDNIIRNKSYDLFDDTEHKSYSVTRVAGSTITSLQFLEGAYKELFTPVGSSPTGFATGVEYRDSYYAAAPGNSYVPELDDVDLASDSFYTAIQPPVFDEPSYPCNPAPDVLVRVDFTNPALDSIRASCDSSNLDGMDFCNNDSSLMNANQNYSSSCPQPQ